MAASQHQQTLHFDTIYTLLPATLKAGIDDLLSRATRESTVKHTLDQLVRFSLGRDATDEDMDSREEWETQKCKAEKALLNLQEGSQNGKKRYRDEENLGSVSLAPNPKRSKIEASAGENTDEDPVFALHSVSVSSPVRKKMDITIYRKNTIRFTHATSGVQEASVPLSSLTRAFLIPTPGKSKAYWTVVMLTQSDQTQVIFGMDATPPSIITTAHPESPHKHPKGTDSKPILTQFLSHLPSHVVFQEPTTNQFRSPAGDPYVDAYLRAKDGHLFFFEDGLLFGEKRPCVWIGMDEIENVRLLSATGRTFSLFVTRTAADVTQDDEPDDDEETEFSMVDGRNQDAVALWVKNNRPYFGIRRETETDVQHTIDSQGELDKREVEQEKPAHFPTQVDSDSEDSDFQSESESDGGSATSQSEEEDGDKEDEEENTEDEEDAMLSPSMHPLLRPGAMPKMSKAAVDAVVDMVEADLKDLSGGRERSRYGQEEEVDELDELDF